MPHQETQPFGDVGAQGMYYAKSIDDELAQPPADWLVLTRDYATQSGDTAALVEAVRRYFSDDALRERLRAAAAQSVAAYAPERVFGELESTLRRVARA